MKQSNRISFRPNGLLFQIIIGCVIGLLIGVSTKWISPLLILAILTVAFFIFAILKRPEIALIAILIATSSIVFEEQLPLLSIGGISLHISDLLLLGMLALILVRRMVEPRFKMVHTPLDWLLIIFFGLALLSTLIAIFHSTVEIEPARRAIRVLSYYLTFFIVTNLVRERHQLKFLLKSLFFLATLVAVVMVVQFLLGSTVKLLPGRVEALNTQGIIYDDITRILPPGQSIVMVAFITITTIFVLDQSTRLLFLQCGLLGLAVLVSFTRGFWIQASLSIGILIILVRGQVWRRLLRMGLGILLLATVTLFLATFERQDTRLTRLISATTERLATLVSDKTASEESLQWRYIENEYALPQIITHPILGLGLGANYRPFDRRIDGNLLKLDTRSYIHNGHLWIILMAGPLAYFFWVCLSIVYLFRGIKKWRQIPDTRMRGVVLGFTLTYMGVLVGAVVRPMFMVWYWTPIIGIIFGVNEVIYNMYKVQIEDKTITRGSYKNEL